MLNLTSEMSSGSSSLSVLSMTIRKGIATAPIHVLSTHFGLIDSSLIIVSGTIAIAIAMIDGPI